MTPPSHYDALGLPVNATAQQIKAAYRRAARATHPDHGGDPAEFRRVSLAYQVLSNPQTRSRYDRSYGAASAPAAPTDSAESFAASAAPRRTPGQRGPSAIGRAGLCARLWLRPRPPPVWRRISPASKSTGCRASAESSVPAPGCAARRCSVQLISRQILTAIPSARLVNGLQSPADNGYIDHALLAGYRLALIDSMLLPRGNFRWDGRTLHKDGRVVDPPQLAPAVRRMQELFPELNVTGWIVIHSADGNLHEPVIDYTRGYDPDGIAPVHVVNAARLVREIKQFLSSGPAPNTVHVPSLARLLAGMHS